MRIQYSNTHLAAGPEPAAVVSCNGTQVNDEVAFFRAAAATYYPRGGRRTEVVLRVGREFTTFAEALQFCCTHFAALPQQGDLVLRDSAGTAQLRLADAVLEAVRPYSLAGVACAVEYTLRGGVFTSEEVALPAPEEELEDVMKVGTINLSAADESKAVAFDEPFASPPRHVSATLSIPAGGAIIAAAVDDTTVAATGFTVLLGAPIPGAGYKLRWVAIL